MTTHLGAGNHVVDAEESMGCDEGASTSLDAYCESSAVPTFIKVDVEGHELEVVRGATRVLSDPKVLGLLVETFRRHNYAMEKLKLLERILRVAGFAPYRYDPQQSRLYELLDEAEGSDNTLYLRDMASIQRRLARG